MQEAIDASQRREFARASALAREAVALDPSLAAGRHAHLLGMLAHDGAPELVARLGPARLNTLVHTGWLHSLYAGVPVNADGLPLPWLSYPAIDFLEQKIRPEWTVLEWGCGQSTLWWAARVKQVVSVEHDPEWYHFNAQRLPANCSLTLVSDPHAYATPPGIQSNGPYHAILIDGIERDGCARTAVANVRPEGIIIVDNSDRPSLRDCVSFLMRQGFLRIDFFGLLPSYNYRICTSVFFKDVSLLGGEPLPCDTRTSLGPTLSQVLDE